MIKTVLVPVAGSDTDGSVFATALQIAKPLAAHLQFLHVHQSAAEAARRSPHMDFARGPAIAEGLEYLRTQGNALCVNALQHYRSFCELHDIRSQDLPASGAAALCASWVEATQGGAEGMLSRARHSDLVVLGRPRHRDYMPADLIETLLIGCGRPIVIAPQSAPTSPLSTVVVGWKETAESARALAAALPLLRCARRVVLLSVTEADAAPRSALEDLASQLTWHGIRAEIVIDSTHPSSSVARLERLASHQQADLLVVGGFGHGPLREHLFGGVTRALIEAAPMPVFMLH